MKTRVVLIGLMLTLLAAVPASAASITILVGDKDGFGLGLALGDELPCADPSLPNCISPIHDWRSDAEKNATNGAKLTDTYSALYDGAESDCSGPGQSCTLNGATGLVIFPFVGELTSASLTFLMADFESEQNGPMRAFINDIEIDFSYDHGYRQLGIDTITLTPEMIAAANAAGEVRLFLDHSAAFFGVGDPRNFGSFDYVAFDYFELQADVVPEPGTWLLLGTGLAALAASRRRRARRS